jgi:hypothetical protein
MEKYLLSPGIQIPVLGKNEESQASPICACVEAMRLTTEIRHGITFTIM